MIVRFDNLADIFDKNNETVAVDVNKFARELYKEVNGKEPTKVKIEELDLQGVHQKTDYPSWTISGEVLPQAPLAKQSLNLQNHRHTDEVLAKMSTMTRRTYRVIFN